MFKISSVRDIIKSLSQQNRIKSATRGASWSKHLITGCDKVSKGAKIRNRYNQVPHLTNRVLVVSLLRFFFSKNIFAKLLLYMKMHDAYSDMLLILKSLYIYTVYSQKTELCITNFSGIILTDCFL